MNSEQWEFLGDFGATLGFREIWVFGVVSGDLGPQKAFAQIVFPCSVTLAEESFFFIFLDPKNRGQKNRTRKKTNSWERRFPGTFRTNVPLILPIFSVFSVGGGPKVPRNFVPGNFFFLF